MKRSKKILKTEIFCILSILDKNSKYLCSNEDTKYHKRNIEFKPFLKLKYVFLLVNLAVMNFLFLFFHIP